MAITALRDFSERAGQNPAYTPSGLAPLEHLANVLFGRCLRCNSDPASCDRNQSSDYMMWSRHSGPMHLRNSQFYFENPLTPIISHVIPSLPMDEVLSKGGKSAAPIGPPLAERPRASVGGKSGTVFIHFREQGRPQGASFSAGDLSRCCRRPKLSRHRCLPLVQACRARRQRGQADGGDERAAECSR